MAADATPDRKVLGEQAFRLAQSCMRRRTPATEAHSERVAAITMRLLEAKVPVEKIEWVLLNAKVLTEAGITYTLNSSQGGLPLKPVEVAPPFRPGDDERERVLGLIQSTRAQLRGEHRPD